MAWFRVDDTFPMNVKSLSCSLNAIGLWTLTGAWSCQQLTDGAIPRSIVEAFASRLLEANSDGASIASELVASGLWDETPGGYQFHDWDDYQYTSKEVEERRVKRAEAGRKGGIKSGQARRSKREASASSNAKQTRSKSEPHPIPSHPIPINSAHADAFDAFWDNYPKKVSKDQARKAYEKRIKQGINPSVLASKALEYATLMEHEQRDKKFIKNPATWLNAAAYEDDMAIPQ